MRPNGADFEVGLTVGQRGPHGFARHQGRRLGDRPAPFVLQPCITAPQHQRRVKGLQPQGHALDPLMLALPMPLDGAAEPFLEPPQPVGLALALPLADMAHALFECRQHGLLAPHQTGRPSEARGATVQPLRLHVQVAPGGILQRLGQTVEFVEPMACLLYTSDAADE